MNTLVANQLQTRFKINLISYTYISACFLLNYLHKKICSYFFLNQYLKKYSFSKNRIKSDAIRVSSIVGAFLNAVYERSLTKSEFENLFVAGAITPLFDEFCDKYNFDDKILSQIFNNKTVSDNLKVDLFICLLNILRQRRENNDQFKFYEKQIFDIQLKSKIQKESKDINLIREMTFEKGGFSLLFYSSCINSVATEQQKKVIHSFGAYVQLLDDIFDIGRDIAEASNTMATLNILNIDNIFKELESLLKKNIDEINELEISGKNKKKLLQIYLLLNVPAISYLNMLKRSSKQHELIDKNNQLNKKYNWSSWNIQSVCQLIKTLI